MGRHQRRHRDSVHVGRGRCVAQRLHRRAVSVTGISSAASLRIEIPGGLRIADNPVESDAMDLLLHAQMLYRTKELALQAVHKLGIGAIGALRTMNRGPRYANDFWITDMPDAVAGALEEILLRS